MTNDSSKPRFEFSHAGAGYLLSIPVMMIWTIASPAANGMMTRRVSESEQGELQGAISSLRAIAVIIGPGLFTFTFAFFIDKRARLEPAGRAMVSRRRLAVLRDDNGDTCRTTTGHDADVEHHSAGANAKRKLCCLI